MSSCYYQNVPKSPGLESLLEKNKKQKPQSRPRVATGHVGLVALWYHSGPSQDYTWYMWLAVMIGHRIQRRWCSQGSTSLRRPFQEMLSYHFWFSGLRSKVPRKDYPQELKLPRSYLPSSKEERTRTSQGGSGRRHWVKSATFLCVCSHFWGTGQQGALITTARTMLPSHCAPNTRKHPYKKVS